MATLTSNRIRFRDVKPYFTPASLDELHGPYDGPVRLRHAVLWAPGDHILDVSRDGERRTAYQALLAEGKPEDQIRGLNRSRLIQDWPGLNMDRRVRDLWESRFPELDGAHA